MQPNANQEHFAKMADEALDDLIACGCIESRAKAGMGRFVYFDGKDVPPIRKSNVADFARMGKVIGWHKPIR